jgi:hypothetical protein
MRDGKIASTGNDGRVNASSSNALELDAEQLSQVSGGRVHLACAAGKHIPIVKITVR